MTPRGFLLLMSAAAVLGDSLLHPFYPQYLRLVFDVSDPAHVGTYVAATSFTVLVAFPAWAVLSRHVPVLELLIGTQSLAALFALAAGAAPSLAAFWALSLAMMVFKASYLLIYPYAMGLEPEGHQGRSIGLLAFVAYFSHLVSAFAAGLVFELAGPRMLLVASAAADLLQLALCVLALRTPALRAARAPRRSERPAALAPPRFFYELGVVMLVFYFSAYLTDPFFSEYWEGRATSNNRLLSGVVFGLPGLGALTALAVDAWTGKRDEHTSIAPMVLLTLLGIALEWSGQLAAIVAGRALYGWALLRVMVRLDLLVFRSSVPDDYAVDFSRVNAFQGLGVMLASSCAGTLVHSFGLRAPFVLSVAGFGLGALLFHVVLARRPLTSSLPELEGAPASKGAFTP